MNIDELRKAAKQMVADGTTQMELSKKSGVPQSVLSVFLRGAGLSVNNYTKLLAVVGE